MQETSEVRVTRATGADELEVARFRPAFDNDVSAEQTRRFLADDRHHLVLGYLDGGPAGFASAVEVFHPDKQPELFLNEIAVVEEARRHGVARALIDELTRLGHERGCSAIWVLTDEQNPPAMALYASTGGRWNGDRQVMFEYVLTRG
jgi:ribosomal protein S18 acetylase RimI-like enzyme